MNADEKAVADVQVPLWDAINRYATTCGGDPSQHVYGNTPRMTAVADTNRVIHNLAARIRAEAERETERERASKNGAYDERNRLVAVLASLFPSSLERHPDEDATWENDWRWIVFVDLPTGQATWHIHDSHLPLFDHVPRFVGRKWDGHNTEAKYKRIEAMTRMTAIDAALKGDA